MMNYKHILLIGVIVGIAIVPIIEAITEPSIIIDMITSQTTNPFVVNDVTSTEIFSISPEGNISNPIRQEFYLNTVHLVNHTVTTEVELNPIILFKADITNPDSSDPIRLRPDVIHIQGMGFRESGSSNCRAGYLTSTDGGSTYDNAIFTQTENGAGAEFGEFNAISSTISIEESATNLIYGLYSVDGATTCTFQNLNGYISIIVPNGWAITQVTP